ncbi:hypothetical protein V9T40_014759 [Parthenolecanium corni]|uniref:Uncharacterized protein n=1 Tax=Parthenolecanium corni TaxID=536013 RepID=A0AAN9TFR9_9HEMI
MLVDTATIKGIIENLESSKRIKREPPTTTTTTTEDWRLAWLATFPSPKPTTEAVWSRSPIMKYLYTKYGLTPTSTSLPRIITGPSFDDEHPPSEPTTTSTTTPAPIGNTRSFMDLMLDKWLKDGYESRHSYTDAYAGLPLKPADIQNYQTDFRQS